MNSVDALSSLSLRPFLNSLNENSISQACFSELTSKNKSLVESKGYSLYSGKVRDCATKGDFFSMIHSDRLSAFDKYITDVPFKGLLLAQMNLFWLEKAKRDFPVAPFSSPHPRVIKMKKLKVFPVEMIVRGYLAGSMLRAYEKGERNFCQHTLPDGLKPWSSLSKPIVTPTWKAEVGSHDENTTPEALIRSGSCTEKEWLKIEKLGLSLYEFGREIYQSLGWIFVDTKYEFAKDEKGNIFLVDELHTPDSSRLWDLSTYESNLKSSKTPTMFDKEIIRRYLSDQGFQGEGKVPHVPVEQRILLAKVYLDVAEKLYGRPLEFSDLSESSLVEAL